MADIAGHLLAALILLALLRKIWQIVGRPGGTRALPGKRPVRRAVRKRPAAPAAPQTRPVRQVAPPQARRLPQPVPTPASVPAEAPKPSPNPEREVLIGKFVAQHKFPRELAEVVVDRYLADRGKKDVEAA